MILILAHKNKNISNRIITDIRRIIIQNDTLIYFRQSLGIGWTKDYLLNNYVDIILIDDLNILNVRNKLIES